MCFRSVQNKMQQTYFLKKVKAHYDYQKSAWNGKAREWVIRKIIVDRWTTYSLRNGSEEDNWVRIFIITYPLTNLSSAYRDIVNRLYITFCLIYKNISCIDGRINSWCLLPESNGQLMIRCDTCKIIAHKLMTFIRIYLNLKAFAYIHSARKN